jgi:tetratricopeptide (TPR) repeat protein
MAGRGLNAGKHEIGRVITMRCEERGYSTRNVRSRFPMQALMRKLLRAVLLPPLQLMQRAVLALLRRRGTHKEAVRAYDLAMRQLANGDSDGALYSAKMAVASDGAWGRAYHALGLASGAKGDTGSAQAAYERALQISPMDPTILVALGDLNLQSQRATEAESWYRKAAESEPTRISDTEFLLKLAIVIDDQGRRTEAAELLDQALTIDPRHPGVLGARSWVLLEEGKHAAAVPLLERAIALEPMSARFHHYLAFALAKLQKWSDAAAYGKTALALTPGDPEIRELVREANSHLPAPE